MAIPPGSYKLGPENGKMLVKTGREGMGGKMGHDLVIEVGRWSATADVGEDLSACSLTGSADVGSMEVVSGEGGVKPLSDGDKAEIKKTIVDKILGDTKIDFKSTSVSGGGSNATVQGELTIAGKTAPVQFQLQDLGGGRIKATGQVVQSNHGVKPFKAFMGALKVKDAVDIEIEDFVPPALPEGEVSKLTGMFHPANSTLTIAKATRSRVDAFGLSFANEGKNGHSAPFSWAA